MNPTGITGKPSFSSWSSRRCERSTEDNDKNSPERQNSPRTRREPGKASIKSWAISPFPPKDTNYELLECPQMRQDLLDLHRRDVQGIHAEPQVGQMSPQRKHESKYCPLAPKISNLHTGTRDSGIFGQIQHIRGGCSL